jgi:hypothetical protein
MTCSRHGRGRPMPQNASTRRRYSRINVLILWGAVIERGFSGQSWLTFRQALHRLAYRAARVTASPKRRDNTLGWAVVGRIISVTQVGDAASVQLSWDPVADNSNGYIDFHNLLRIDGVWKITNKTASHSSRYLSEITERVMREEVHRETGDAGKIDESAQFGR